jgi:8-oxo-dGTP diphosphatase
MSEQNRQLVVVVALIERDGNMLIVRRHDPLNSQWHQRWQFPGGKIHAGETPLEALHREVREETNLSIHSTKLLGVHTHNWKISQGIQQTFILPYLCAAHPGEIVLDLRENDLYLWEKPEEIVKRPNFLEGNLRMMHDLYFQTKPA